MYTILIADDEAEIRNGLCNFFPWKSIGFEVIGQAENGQQAYDFLKKQQVDVLLCDIVMPVVSGLDLAKHLYEENNPVQIIFMSAFTDFQYAKKGMEYGVKNYILKSMHFDDLIQTLSRIKTELDDLKQTADQESECLPYNEKIISHIKKHVKENYSNVTLENIAIELNMNSDYLSKFFKKYSGRAFSDYVMQVRMKKAAELLQDISYKIYEISEIVGYSNQFNFTRAFKSFFGKTPREYRQSCKQ